jgi:hypothetical protein
MDAYSDYDGCGRAYGRSRGMAERERALGALLDDAVRALADDPDVAGLLLDGALSQIVARWYTRRRLMEPDARGRLADLARRDAPFAWRLRLALRASDPAARLEHARHLLRALDERDPADARRANDANEMNDEVIARAAG